MEPIPQPPKHAHARLPAAVLEAYECYCRNGDPAALAALVRAAVIDYRPAGAGAPPLVSDDMRLFEDLGYDSVAVPELIFFFEDLFDLSISNEDIAEVGTLGDLGACVAQKLAARQDRTKAITG